MTGISEVIYFFVGILYIPYICLYTSYYQFHGEQALKQLITLIALNLTNFFDCSRPNKDNCYQFIRFCFFYGREILMDKSMLRRNIYQEHIQFSMIRIKLKEVRNFIYCLRCKEHFPVKTHPFQAKLFISISRFSKKQTLVYFV